jgi:hypothetical protein
MSGRLDPFADRFGGRSGDVEVYNFSNSSGVESKEPTR